MLKYLTGTAIIAGLLAVGAAGAMAQQKYTFALVPKNMNNPFFDQARDGCKKAEAEANGAFECMYIGPGEHGGGAPGGEGSRHPGAHLGLRHAARE